MYQIRRMFIYKEVKSNDTTILSLSMRTFLMYIVGKLGRILGIVAFIFNTNFQNVSYVFVNKTVQWAAII